MALADLSESSEPGLAHSQSKWHERTRPFKSYISQPLDAAARGDVSMTLGKLALFNKGHLSQREAQWMVAAINTKE